MVIKLQLLTDSSWIFSYVNIVIQCSTFSECFVGRSGGNKDTGSAVDTVTPADCKASG
jgi:hypothetical protein